MRWLSLVLLVLLLTLPYMPTSGRTKTIDYDALEKSWEVGDDDVELRTEGDDHYRKLAVSEEDEAKALGPQMVFVTIKDDGNRHQEALPDIASRWKEMLWNGGVVFNIYEVAKFKLLIGLQKGIFLNDVLRFLDEQNDVKEYEWNGKTYSDKSKFINYTHQKHRRKKAHVAKSKDSSARKHRKHFRRKTPQSALTGEAAKPRTTKVNQHLQSIDEL